MFKIPDNTIELTIKEEDVSMHFSRQFKNGVVMDEEFFSWLIGVYEAAGLYKVAQALKDGCGYFPDQPY